MSHWAPEANIHLTPRNPPPVLSTCDISNELLNLLKKFVTYTYTQNVIAVVYNYMAI